MFRIQKDFVRSQWDSQAGELEEESELWRKWDWPGWAKIDDSDNPPYISVPSNNECLLPVPRKSITVVPRWAAFPGALLPPTSDPSTFRCWLHSPLEPLETVCTLPADWRRLGARKGSHQLFKRPNLGAKWTTSPTLYWPELVAWPFIKAKELHEALSGYMGRQWKAGQHRNCHCHREIFLFSSAKGRTHL